MSNVDGEKKMSRGSIARSVLQRNEPIQDPDPNVDELGDYLAKAMEEDSAHLPQEDDARLPSLLHGITGASTGQDANGPDPAFVRRLQPAASARSDLGQKADTEHSRLSGLPTAAHVERSKLLKDLLDTDRRHLRQYEAQHNALLDELSSYHGRKVDSIHQSMLTIDNQISELQRQRAAHQEELVRLDESHAEVRKTRIAEFERESSSLRQQISASETALAVLGKSEA